MDENKVWQRVTAGHSAPDVGEGQGLLARIAAEERDAALYAKLAHAAKGGMAQALAAMASDERAHACRLRAIYFAETGSCACPAPLPLPDTSDLWQALRPRLAEELRAAQAYEQAGGRYAPLYRKLAESERRHAEVILCLLGRYVCK